MLLKILLSGNGGQGIQLLSDLIVPCFMESGFEVNHIPNYGLEQRGGVSLAFIKISDIDIVYPKFTTPDVLLIMSDQARGRVENHRAGVCFDINDYLEKLKTENISVQSYNIFFLGVLSSWLEKSNIFSIGSVWKLLETKLKSKPGWEENIRAWELGTKN